MEKIKNISKMIYDNAMLIIAFASFVLFCIAGIVKEDMDSAILFHIIMWSSLIVHSLFMIERKIDKFNMSTFCNKNCRLLIAKEKD